METVISIAVKIIATYILFKFLQLTTAMGGEFFSYYKYGTSYEYDRKTTSEEEARKNYEYVCLRYKFFKKIPIINKSKNLLLFLAR